MIKDSIGEKYTKDVPVFGSKNAATSTAQHDKHAVLLEDIHTVLNQYCNLAAVGTDVLKVLTMMERKLKGHNVFMAD